MIAPTQSGKTVFLQAALADTIDQDPGPVLYVLPDEKTGKKAIDEKVVAMINNSPDLAIHKTDKVKDISMTHIRLDHMSIYSGWAGSLASMSMIPCKRVYLDEVRLMPLTQGAESNAIKMSFDRLTTFMGYGIAQGYLVSSPSIEGDLLHQQLSVPGTLFVAWAVPCPHCGEFQVLDFFKNMKDTKTHPKCLCKYCSYEFQDMDKKKSWNIKGRYVYMDCSSNQWHPLVDKQFDYNNYTRVFFTYDSMVSPFRSFKRIAREYVETKDKLHDYKNFIQCWCAKFWIDDKSKATELTLNERKSPEHSKGDIPNFTKVVTAGIDTQDAGFYVVVRSWGPLKQTALIDEYFIPCDIKVTDASDIKKVLERDVFNRVYRGRDSLWKIGLCTIDTGGHRTKELYSACSNFSRLKLIKGASDLQNVTIKWSKEYGIYLVRTSEYLDETDIRSTSPDYILPHDVSRDYIVQFCNRRRVFYQNKKTGEQTVVWRKIGQYDYRMAEVHAFICMDLPTDRGMFRARVEEPDFIYNPYAEEEAIKKFRPKIDSVEDRQEEEYHIPDLNWEEP